MKRLQFLLIAASLTVTAKAAAMYPIPSSVITSFIRAVDYAFARNIQNPGNYIPNVQPPDMFHFVSVPTVASTSTSTPSPTVTRIERSDEGNDTETLEVTNKTCSPDQWPSFFHAHPNIHSIKLKIISYEMNFGELPFLMSQPQFQEKLTELHIRDHVDGEDLAALKQAKNLKVLNLMGTVLRQGLLGKILTNSPFKDTLIGLGLPFFDYSPDYSEDLAVVSSLTKLQRLDLHGTSFEGGMVAVLLKNFKSRDSLIELNLAQTEGISREDLEAVTQLPNLQKLHLMGTSIEGGLLTELMPNFKSKNSLIELDLSYCDLLPCDLASLAQLRNLKKLSLGGEISGYKEVVLFEGDQLTSLIKTAQEERLKIVDEIKSQLIAWLMEGDQDPQNPINVFKRVYTEGRFAQETDKLQQKDGLFINLNRFADDTYVSNCLFQNPLSPGDIESDFVTLIHILKSNRFLTDYQNFDTDCSEVEAFVQYFHEHLKQSIDGQRDPHEMDTRFHTFVDSLVCLSGGNPMQRAACRNVLNALPPAWGHCTNAAITALENAECIVAAFRNPHLSTNELMSLIMNEWKRDLLVSVASMQLHDAGAGHTGANENVQQYLNCLIQMNKYLSLHANITGVAHTFLIQSQPDEKTLKSVMDAATVGNLKMFLKRSQIVNVLKQFNQNQILYRECQRETVQRIAHVSLAEQETLGEYVGAHCAEIGQIKQFYNEFAKVQQERGCNPLIDLLQIEADAFNAYFNSKKQAVTRDNVLEKKENISLEDTAQIDTKVSEEIKRLEGVLLNSEKTIIDSMKASGYITDDLSYPIIDTEYLGNSEEVRTEQERLMITQEMTEMIRQRLSESYFFLF